MKRLDPEFDNRLKVSYDAAMEEGLWRGYYAASNRDEYWAEAAGIWFHAHHSYTITTREALKKYDPGLATLLTEIFGDGDWRYTPPATRTYLPHLQGFNPEDSPKYDEPLPWQMGAQELDRQLRDPNSDGDGKWVNLELHDPSQLPSLLKSTTRGRDTSIFYVKLTEKAFSFYTVNADGTENLHYHATRFIFDFPTYAGAIWLIKDHTGKDLAVFRAEEKTGRVIIGTGPPTTGIELAIEKPPELTRDNFTIGPGEFAILAHNGQQAIVKQDNFKTYNSYFTLGTDSGNPDFPNLTQFFQDGGRIELISHVTVNPLPSHSGEAEFGDIVISEIMWGLDGTSPAKQYIELYNASAHAYSFADADVSLRFSTVSEESLPDGAFPPPYNTDVRVKVIDRVSNNGWKVPGRSGNTSESKPLISMYRTIDYTTEDMPDGTLVSSWKASTGRVNLSTPNYGTPGASHLPPTPVVLVESSQRPPMYWIDAKAGTLHRLIGDKVKSLVSNVQNVSSFAVDTPRDRVYWVEKTGDHAGKVKRANLDGSDVKLVKDLTSGPLDIALDTTAGKIYLINSRGKIQRLNVDGSNFQSNLITGLESPKHITLDVTGNRIYWTEQTSDTSGEIRHANLDGSDVGLVKDLTSPPRGIAFDTANDKLYLTNAWGKIQRLNVDGSNFQSNLITGLDAPQEVSVDVVGKKIYWAEQRSIRRADLNGENIEDVVMGLEAPTGIVLGTVPAAAPAAPKIAEPSPDATVLLANYPNPFNPETWIPYQLGRASDVKVTIYDARGVVVRQLVLGHQAPGFYTSPSRAAYWDGRNALGERVASGIYFYQLQADNVSSLRKMLILK